MISLLFFIATLAAASYFWWRANQMPVFGISSDYIISAALFITAAVILLFKIFIR